VLNSDVAPHVIGCPSAVITQYVRKVATDLCERAKVWRVDLTPQLLADGDYTYDFVSPIANTEVSAILSAKCALPSGDIPLEVYTHDQVVSAYPLYPDANAKGQPLALTRMDAATYNVVPIPDDQGPYTVSLYAAIRPTATATQMEDSVMYEYRRTIFHGVLHELMLLPNRAWTNDKMAVYHGKQWEYFLYNARARANKGFGTVDISVTPRPWA